MTWTLKALVATSISRASVDLIPGFCWMDRSLPGPPVLSWMLIAILALNLRLWQSHQANLLFPCGLLSFYIWIFNFFAYALRTIGSNGKRS